MDKNKYTLPEDDAIKMASEPTALSQQYAADLRYGMEVLSKVSPEELHHIVVYISDYTSKRSTSLADKFNALFDEWWQETCIYSGPNLCYDNDNYRTIKAMGTAVLPFIDEKASTQPDYMQRHIQWLRKGILS